MLILEKDLNALVVLILSGVLLAAFGVQIFLHEQPCPLCLLQRLGMLGAASGLILNICFGVRMSHYALSLLSSLMGGFVALRQISLHVCPGFPVFGLPVLGLSLYTWSFVVFACTILAIAFLLFLYNPKESEQAPASPTTLGKTACSLIFFIAVANVVTTFLQCGWGPCVD